MDIGQACRLSAQVEGAEEARLRRMIPLGTSELPRIGWRSFHCNGSVIIGAF